MNSRFFIVRARPRTVREFEMKKFTLLPVNTGRFMAYCRYGRVCRLVKLRISMIRTFSFGNIPHITLYAQLEID